MNLCHVMAWYDIKCRMDKLLEEAFNAEKYSSEYNDQNYNNIRGFLSKLFAPDIEAVVNFGAWYPPLTFEAWDKPNKPWYEQTPVVRHFVGGKRKINILCSQMVFMYCAIVRNLFEVKLQYLLLDYMTKDLEELRNDYESKALSLLDPKTSRNKIDFWRENHENDLVKLLQIRKQNAKAIDDLLVLANMSPSNLRYGDRSSNMGIRANFDPMGDKRGYITVKEAEILKTYVITKNTEEFFGQYYLRSSTGKYQPDINDKTVWYIKCLANNIECV